MTDKHKACQGPLAVFSIIWLTLVGYYLFGTMTGQQGPTPAIALFLIVPWSILILIAAKTCLNQRPTK